MTEDNKYKSKHRIIADRFFLELELFQKFFSLVHGVKVKLYEKDMIKLDGEYFWKDDTEKE